jgi:hypothetical protein
MSDALTGLIRTWVPVAVGAFIAWLVTLGVELDPQTEAGLITGLTALAIAIYYSIVRLLEAKWPAVGILLGAPKAPFYELPQGEHEFEEAIDSDGNVTYRKSVTRYPRAE